MSPPLNGERWSIPWKARPLQIALAREAGVLLLRDSHHWLTLLNPSGARQAQFPRPAGLSAAAISEDGSAIVALDSSGAVIRLGPDLKPMWEQRVDGKGISVALDVAGDYALVGSTTGKLRLLDRGGETAREYICPRPAHQLVLLPSLARVLVAGEFGFVGCLDLKSGDWIWKDAPVVYLGTLSATDSGELTVVTCFSDGLRVYRENGQLKPFSFPTSPCRAARLSVKGDRLLLVTTNHQVKVLTVDTGKPLLDLNLESEILSTAFGPEGESVFLGLAARKVTRYDL